MPVDVSGLCPPRLLEVISVAEIRYRYSIPAKQPRGIYKSPEQATGLSMR